jgi:hypothetical protein
MEVNEAEVSLEQNYNGVYVTAARRIVGSGSMRCITVYLHTLYTDHVLKTCFSSADRADSHVVIQIS